MPIPHSVSPVDSDPDEAATAYPCRDCGRLFPHDPEADRCPDCVRAMIADHCEICGRDDVDLTYSTDETHLLCPACRARYDKEAAS